MFLLFTKFGRELCGPVLCVGEPATKTGKLPLVLAGKPLAVLPPKLPFGTNDLEVVPTNGRI